MSNKVSKNIKFKCRVRPVRQEKLDKLYEGIDKNCRNCINDCKSIDGKRDIEGCEHKKQGEHINEIIQMLKDENVNLLSLCESYNLKLNILIEMLRGNRILTYKYYIIIKNRLHMIKDSDEINRDYSLLFHKDGVVDE